MIGKIKSSLLGVLCAVCLQVPMNVCAVDLPFVPVEEPPVGSSAVVSETAVVIEEPADRETPIMTEAPAASKAAETAKATAAGDRTAPSESAVSVTTAAAETDSERNELPVLSPDGEKMAETSESSTDMSLSSEAAARDTQTVTDTDSRDTAKTSRNSRIPLTLAAICCAVVIAGAVLFAIAKNRGKK